MRMLFDTSALLKRYMPERGRERVLALIAQADPLVVAPHTRVELLSAINRLRREGVLSDEGYARTRAEIDANFADMEVVPLSPLVERAAIQALERAPLRAADALHVGAAHAALAEVFVTADVRQARGAEALGLRCEALVD